jgi:WD40 repeat protein
VTGEELFNPFPGLRPFEANEDYLFFGREEHTDELLRRLRRHRFLAVIGESGSGKSSVVRAGMLPALYGGFLAGAGSDWRIAVLRPGGDPIGNLAAALGDPEVLDPDSADDGERQLFREMAAASLRRSRLALVQLVREARLKKGENLLVLVDQFEELFRFRRERAQGAADEAVAFANLLLSAAASEDSPIYVLITMRSDFLGDCTQIPGLPEAINTGQYLIPRLDRRQRERAIVGPAGVGGAKLSTPLVQQLLNDIGDEPDQLPILQHALMRTFDHWLKVGPAGQPIGLEHYQAVGTLREALSRHAEEAFAEVPENLRPVAERAFKALTESGASGRGIRRPAKLGQLAAIAGCSLQDMIRVVEIFRAPGRAFLMPPAEVPLAEDSVIDISHESLMRTWGRLADWTEEEKICVLLYRRLKETAELAAAGEAGLWRDPDLRIALEWRHKNEPTAGWAERYGGAFGEAMSFLDRSCAAAEAELAAARAAQQQKIRNARTITAISLAALLVAVAFVVYALFQNSRMEKQNRQVRSRQLALLAAEREDDDHELALLLALEAGRAALTVEAENVLRRQLRHPGRTVALLPDLGDDVVAVEFSKEGHRLLTAGRDGRAALWDPFTHSREPLCWMKGHDAALWSASFSPDGTRVVTTSGDGTARIWDAADCRQLHLLEGHDTLVPYASWDEKGERLATVGYDHTARIWSADGRELRVLPHTNQAVDVEWLGDLVATSDLTPAVRVWGATDGRLLAAYPTAELPRPVRHLEWLGRIGPGPDPADLPWLLLAGDDGRLRNWNLFERGVSAPEAVHLDWISGVWPAPVRNEDGTRRLLTTGRDRVARFFSFADGEVAEGTRRLRAGATLRHAGVVNSADWTADGARVATAAADFLVRIFRYPEPRPEVLLTGHTAPVLDVAFSADGTRVATAGEDDAVRIWDPAPGVETAELKPHHGPVWGAEFSPDGSQVATVGEDGRLHLTPPGGGEAVVLELERPALALAWHPDGRRIAVAGSQGLLEVWDAPGRRRLLRLAESGGSLTRVAYSPDGGTLAAAGRDRTARLYDGESGRQLAALPHDAWVSDLVFSPDGKKIATAAVDNDLRLFDSRSGALIYRLAGHSSALLDLDWDPRGKKIATASSDRSVRLWDAILGKPLHVLEGHEDWVFEVAFSPDGSRLASASKDTSARLWDPATGREIAELPNHILPVRHLAWSADGGRLFTASEDHTARLWRAGDGLAITTLTGHGAPLSGISTSSDGSHILTTDTEGRVLVHFARLADLLAAGCQRSVRGLTEEEWRLYGDGGEARPTCPIPEAQR